MPSIRLGIIAGTGRLYAGPSLVALGRGYFSDQGLDIEVVEVSSARPGMAMLASGELDVAPLGPGFYFFRAWSPESPMVMVADQGQLRPGRGSGGIVARPALVESGQLRDFADLRGKRLGVSPDRGDHDWLTFNAALQRGGLSFDDMELVTIDFGDERHKALADGTIDVSTVGRLSSIMEGRAAGAFVMWKADSEIQPGRQQFAVMFSGRFNAERSDLARRYVHAYLQGARDYYAAFDENRNRDEIVNILAARSGYTAAQVANEMVPQGVDPNGRLNTAAIGADLEWLQKEGLFAQPIALDRVIDESHLNAALAALGEYKAQNPVISSG